MILLKERTMIIRDKRIINLIEKSKSGQKKKYLSRTYVMKDLNGNFKTDYVVYAIIGIKEQFHRKPQTYYLTIIYPYPDLPNMTELIPIKDNQVEIIDPALPKSWISKTFNKPIRMISSQFGQEVVITSVSGYRYIVEELSILANLWDDGSWLPEKMIQLAKQSEDEISEIDFVQLDTNRIRKCKTNWFCLISRQSRYPERCDYTGIGLFL